MSTLILDSRPPYQQHLTGAWKAFILVTAAVPRDISPATLRYMRQLDAALVLKPFDIHDMLEAVASAATRVRGTGETNQN